MDRLPAMRTDIELLPARWEGRDVLLVKDPLGIAAQGTVLPAELAPCLALFDGSSSVEDLQLFMMRQAGGALVFRSDAEALAARLARAGLLETDEFRAARQRIVRAFAASPERPAALAGSAYPADPGELAAFLDGVLARAALGTPPAGGVRGLACPHIDLRVAREAYGAAYRTLGNAAPDAVFLLGTGHAVRAGRYCLCAKTFSTPLGRIPADAAGVARIEAAARGAVSPDDFPHRGEHSLEFQLLFLQRLFPMERIPILPVLCGPMEDLFETPGGPLGDAGIASFVEAGRAWLAEHGGRALVLGGVDLCHVGPKFGDARSARALEPDVRAHDRALLEALAAGDADALFAEVARVRNRYRVCGLSALWTLLALLPGVEGTVLDYGIWHEEPTRSAVSFASVAFAPRSPAE